MPIQCLELIGWQPATANQLLRANPFVRSRMLRRDAEQVARHALAQGITHAIGRRKVTLVIRYRRGSRSGKCDPDALFKSTLDALVNCALLKDDCDQWCVLGTPLYEASKKKGLVILLEDLPANEDWI